MVSFHLVGCLFTVLCGGSSAFLEAFSWFWVLIEDLLQFELIFLTHMRSGIGFTLHYVDTQLSHNHHLDHLIWDQKLYLSSKKVL